MIINKDKRATAEDVYKLSQKMKQVVKNRFNLDLVREVQLVGIFNEMPEGITSTIW